MMLSLCNCSEGVFKYEFRRQLLASISVTLITFCHGIGLGWLSPMLTKLQTPAESPLGFSVSVAEASWMGALICVGGLIGNIGFGFVMDYFGRKISIYCLVIPHMCLWMLLYFATSIEHLYIARVCGGLTGGGVYIVLPIFIGEIADPTIRGRLTSLFALTMNTGILIGYILSSHLPYHVIPTVVFPLPLLYLFFAMFLKETPQHLLRQGLDEEAEQSFNFYRNNKLESKEETLRFHAEFMELRDVVSQQKSKSADFEIRDFFTKRALKAQCTGIILMILATYSGSFALVNYMSIVFAAIKSNLHPNTSTIIIGVVQIVGTIVSIMLVDRFGRKILMIISTSGMGLSLSALGMYAFFAEETSMDLSHFSSWLPLFLMGLIIFLANAGINSVTYIILVEILPAKIRSKVSSLCMALLSILVFGLLKFFPIFMDTFGLAATMWFCATVCAFGLFYISIFLEETKGKSVDKD